MSAPARPLVTAPLLSLRWGGAGSIWLAHVLPLLLLLALQGRMWLLVRGELDPAAGALWRLLGVAGACLLGSALAQALWLHVRRARLRVWNCLILLASGIAYLAWVAVYTGRMLPAAVTAWMLPETQFLYPPFALVMPGLLHAGLWLSARPVCARRGPDMAASLLVLVGAPVGLYGLVAFLHALHVGRWPEAVLTGLVVLGTTVVLLAALRLLLHLRAAMDATPALRIAGVALAGWIGPLAGLWVNRSIAFPHDFQHVLVYALVVANGLALLLPAGRVGWPGWAAWLTRCAGAPFALYFCAVFLPYLPLALLGMLAAGLGLLLLTPTALAAIQTRLLAADARALTARHGVWRVAGAGFVVALVLPGALLARAWCDRLAMGAMLDAAFRPDYRMATPTVAPSVAARALGRLAARERNESLPFLSAAYDRVVFDGLTLPAHRMRLLARMFLGSEAVLRDASASRAWPFFGAGRRGAWRASVVPPPRDVALAALDVAHRREGDVVVSTVELALRNDGAGGAEFVTVLDVPPGVLVDGFWLRIGEDYEPGRLFERRAAEWVYRQIRDSERRDPGLLVYETDRRLRLRVFPLAARETRHVRLQFRYAAALSPRLRVGERTIEPPPPPAGAPTLLRVADAEGAGVIVPPGSVPLSTRPAGLAVLVDASAAARGDIEGLVERTVRLLERHPQWPARLYVVGDGMLPLSDGPVSAARAAALLRDLARRPHVFRGGFCAELAMRRLLRHPPDADEAQLFVAVTAEGGALVAVPDALAPFGRLAPDAAWFHVLDANGDLTRYAFDGAAGEPVAHLAGPDPAQWFAVVGSDRVGRIGVPPGGGLLAIPPGARLRGVDAGGGNGILPERVAPGDDPYAMGLCLWQAWERSVFDPAVAGANPAALVGRSRAAGVLLPVTAWIVVERSAHWEALRRAEQASRGARAGFDFADGAIEASEPPLWLVVLLLGVAAAVRRVRRRAVGP